MILTIYHALAVNSEPVTLSSTSPAGITVLFSPSSPVNLPADKNVNVTLNIIAGASVAPANDTISVQGVSGANTQTASFTLRIVQYRVVMVRSTFLPAKMNVTAGSTVYWQNIDGPAGGCGGASSGTGYHNVVFTTIPGANSSTIKQFGIYSYTFTTPGSYFYYSSLDADHSMNGTINVIAASGAGMGGAAKIPAFSYFKGASTAATTSTAAKPASSSTATSPAMAGGLALAGLLALSAGSSTSSGLGLAAGLMVLISFAILGAVFVMSARSKRNTTVLSVASPSGSSL